MNSFDLGRAGDCSGWENGPESIIPAETGQSEYDDADNDVHQPIFAFSEEPSDEGGEVYDMRELLDLHQVNDLDRLWLADTIDIVPGEIDEHDMLGPVLFAFSQYLNSFLVLYTRQKSVHDN